MTILTIGGATIDTIITHANNSHIVIHNNTHKTEYLLLENGIKVEVTNKKFFSGGGATNAAVAFKKMNFAVLLFCKLGTDADGQFVLNELQRYGLNTENICYSQILNTASSYVIPALNGDRIVFAYRGANADLLTTDIPYHLLQRADLVYITSLSNESAQHLPAIVQFAQTQGALVVINPGTSQLQHGSGFIKDSLYNINILILNYEEAQKLYLAFELTTQAIHLNSDNIFTLEKFFKLILAFGVKIVVVTNGATGVYAANKKNFYFYEAIKTQHVVNSLGAGDAFGSSFSAAIYLGKSLTLAMCYGLINSSSVIQYPDAKSGLLTMEILEQQALKLHHTHPLQTFNF